MRHLYWYRLRSFLADRTYMFWSLAFPLLMATFFGLSFGSIATRAETFAAVPVAVVEGIGNGGESEEFAEVVRSLSEGDDALLAATFTTEADADALLEKGDVAGVLRLGDDISLTCKNEGLDESILKNIVDSYLQINATAGTIAQQDPAAVEGALRQLLSDDPATARVSLSGGSLDYMLQNFYALIAMTCLYGGFFGLIAAVQMQPDLSALGTRRGITPTKKSAQVASDGLASLTVVLADVCILLLFLRFVLRVQLGTQAPAMVLLCLVGCLCGVALGFFLGAVVRGSQNMKEGILIALSLALSFLGGLMYWNMRYVVEQTLPIANRLNPAALIVDAFYALDAYGVGARYWQDLLVLMAITAVLVVSSVLALRRKQYASL